MSAARSARNQPDAGSGHGVQRRRPGERCRVGNGCGRLRARPPDRSFDLSAVMRTADASTLVVVGAQDALTGVEGARAVADSIPGARLEVIDDCGHAPHLETPMTFARIVTAFLVG